MGRLRTAGALARAAFAEWRSDNAPRLGAALAYYSALSLAPLLLVILGIAGMALGEDAARGRIIGEIRNLVGEDGGQAIQDILANARRPESGVIATLIGVTTLLVGASGVFGELQSALNTVWDVEEVRSQGWLRIIKDRFLSLTMVLGTGFLLLVSLVVTAAVSAAGELLRNFGPAFEALTQLAVFVVSLGVITVLFALIFKYLPEVTIAWRDVWIGAFTTAVLFVLGKSAIGLYLGHASIGSAYGAAGSFVVLLVWVYYSAQILLFGAELTQVYAKQRSERQDSARAAPPKRSAAAARRS
jgi:membrane protein